MTPTREDLERLAACFEAMAKNAIARRDDGGGIGWDKTHDFLRDAHRTALACAHSVVHDGDIPAAASLPAPAAEAQGGALSDDGIGPLTSDDVDFLAHLYLVTSESDGIYARDLALRVQKVVRTTLANGAGEVDRLRNLHASTLAERDQLRAELNEARREIAEQIDEANRLDAARDQDTATIANLKVWNNQLRDEVASWRAWCSKTLGHGRWDCDDEGRAAIDAKLAAAKAGPVERFAQPREAGK